MGQHPQRILMTPNTIYVMYHYKLKDDLLQYSNATYNNRLNAHILIPIVYIYRVFGGNTNNKTTTKQNTK